MKFKQAAGCSLGAGCIFLAGAAAAQTVTPGEKAAVLPEVVTSASRSEERAMDTAASINVVNAQSIHDGQAEQNISESLARVPGIFALNRQNYAQDLLISSRGFGANSTFGARGIKIFVDGIPGTLADGQGQISHVDLASADRIEVMRGPFSALYGNSAGGVINIFTGNGRAGHTAEPYFSAGSYGQRKYGLKLDGEQNNINYVMDVGNLHTDGFRDHSNTDRQNANLKVNFKLGTDTDLTLIGNELSMRAQDPLGLTATQLFANARGAGTNAIAFNSRKSVDQAQGGATLTQRIGGSDTLTLTPYYGDRHTVQYLASSTNPATLANGVINLQRAFYGLNGNWLHTGTIAGGAFKFVAGMEGNENHDHRLAYTNTRGELTGIASQDYGMQARSRDAYAQTEFRPTDRWALSAGLRRSQTLLNSVSNLAAIPSQGSHTYYATTGMASAQYYLQEQTNVYVSYGTGFDTPTLNQIFYSPAFVAGSSAVNRGNIGLQAAQTRQIEIGLKSELSPNTRATFALFDAVTTDDIVIAINNSGRTAFANVPRTGRQGAEISMQSQLPYNLQFSAAYTVVKAQVSQAYTQFNGVVVNSGSRIPGVPGQGLFGELMWRKPDRALEFAVEARAAGSIAANDLNTEYAGGYGLLNLRVVARQPVGRWAISEFARVDNLLDRNYVGSLIVNQASRQYYESAPGRNWLAGVRASYTF